MEITALCSRLLMFLIVLLAAHMQRRQTQTEALRLTVDRLQFFEYESVSFLCDAADGSTELRGIRTDKKLITTCDMKTTTLTCTIEAAYESDSGVYWCETGRGEKSNTVSIAVTAGSVILEAPAAPVLEGNDVTLRCRNKTKSTNLPAHFYKDGVPVNNSPTEETILYNVSKSDEGFYNCSIPDVGASPRSWLSVREKHPVEENQHGSSDVLVSLLVFIILTAALLLLLGLLRKHRASVEFCFSSNTLTAATNSEQDNQTGENSADDGNTLTYAVVVTKQRKNKDAAEYTSLESNRSRKPQEDGDKDGPVYSTVNVQPRREERNQTNEQERRDQKS